VHPGGALMDELTMRSRARLVVLQLEATVKRCLVEVENGTYSGALAEARTAKPHLIDLCVLLEMLATKEP
jgi:hypothetical protein